MQAIIQPALHVSLLGSFTLQNHLQNEIKETRRKTQALLAWLLLESDQSHNRDQLVSIFWPEMDQQKGRNNLRVSLSQLRKHLIDQDSLVTSRSDILFRSSDAHLVDVNRFEYLIKQTENHNHNRLADCKPCQDKLREAITLYRGSFLEGLTLHDCEAFEEWRFVWRERLHLLALKQMSRLIEADITNNQLQSAESMARHQLKQDSLRETAHRQLMQILSKLGNRTQALQQYKLCAEILQKELGIPPDEETEHLRNEIEQGKYSPSPAKKRLPVDPILKQKRLHVYHTPFFGREEELTLLEERLLARTYRLVSIVGPGGIGKTRLAQEVGNRVFETFKDGVHFVPLVGVQSKFDIPAAIAETLGITLIEGRTPESQLRRWLANKSLLLILDNFEHLMSGVSLISDILDTTSHLVIMITSRERLNLQAEDLFRLKGLPYPPNLDDLEAGHYAAVRLFGDRAHRLNKQFWLNEDTLSNVVKICHLVEGLPLALELAATSIREYTVDEIAEILTIEPELLATDLRDVPVRHRQFETVFDVSWQLLSEEEQNVLAKLSIFRGGFTKQAARTVTGSGAVTLTQLLYKSLIRADRNRRLSMHELTRQFAAEKLALTPLQKAEAEKEHAIFYLERIKVESVPLIHTEPIAAFERLHEDFDDIRIAWDRGFFYRLFPNLQDAIQGFIHYFIRSGRSREAINILDLNLKNMQAIKPDKDVNLLKGFLLTFHGYLLTGLYDLNAKRSIQKSLSFSESIDNPYLLTLNYYLQGRERNGQNEMTDALRFLDKGSDLARQHRFLDILILTLRLQGHSNFVMRNYDLAEEQCTEAIELSQEFNLLPEVQSTALGELGNIVSDLGRLEEGMAYLERALTVQKKSGNPRDKALLLHHLASIEIRIGLTFKASQRMYAALKLCEEIGDHYLKNWARYGLAESLRKNGQPAEALAALQPSLQDIDQHLHSREIGLIMLELGNCYQALEHWGEAKTKYQQALESFGENGYPNELALAQTGIAYIKLKEGDGLAAYKMIEPLVEKLEKIDTTGWDNRLRPYLFCCTILEAMHDDRATTFLTKSKLILDEMISKIESDEIRKAMVENIPEHREILSLASSM